MSRDDALLLDMLQAARQACSFVAGLKHADFIASALHQNAMIRSLEIVGEAASKVSRPAQDAHPEIAWRQMTGMRNRLINAYANVSLDTVWDVVQKKLPNLIDALTPLVPLDEGPDEQPDGAAP